MEEPSTPARGMGHRSWQLVTRGLALGFALAQMGAPAFVPAAFSAHFCQHGTVGATAAHERYWRRGLPVPQGRSNQQHCPGRGLRKRRGIATRALTTSTTGLLVKFDSQQRTLRSGAAELDEPDEERTVAELAEEEEEEEEELDQEASQEPGVGSIGGSRKEICENAAKAAIKDLAEAGTNATTVILPSGAGDVVIGLRIVMGLAARAPSASFRAVVLVPAPFFGYAEEIYREQLGGNAEVHIVEPLRREVQPLKQWLTPKQKTTIILSRYDNVQHLGLVQRNMRRGAVDVLVLESAHLVRAGAYHASAMDNNTMPALKRVYVSARRLAGLAPGALLAPGQEPGYPKEETGNKFGQEVFRLSHAHAAATGMIAPVRLAFLQASTPDAVAEELAELHRALGLKRFEVLGTGRSRLAPVLHSRLSELTDGMTTVGNGTSTAEPSIDAVIITGSSPDYAQVCQELPRLGHPAPGKKCGLILSVADSRNHTRAAWLALAIEDVTVETALQMGAIKRGSLIGRYRLRWKEIPLELRRFVYGETTQKRASLGVNRGIESLGDEWDRWYGRLLRFKDDNGHVWFNQVTLHDGFNLGYWVKEQRDAWQQGLLHPIKVARLRRTGLMIDPAHEVFDIGIKELTNYIREHRKSTVPFTYKSQSGFRLGEWVVEQRVKVRRGKLEYAQQVKLRNAFFAYSQSEEPSVFKHPPNKEAAELTNAIEKELQNQRWLPLNDRRKLFRSLVLYYHPDVSAEKHAESAITFLADAKTWFLGA